MQLLLFALAFVIAILIIVIFIALRGTNDDFSAKIGSSIAKYENQYQCTLAQVTQNNACIHLGIIPDGNRRWRAKHNCDVGEYLAKIKEIVISIMAQSHNNMDANGNVNKKYQNLALIDALSIYVLSKDNLTKRNDDTLVMIRECLKMIISAEWMPWNRIRVQFVGELELLPEDIQDLCEEISSRCQGDFVITAAIGYDPVIDVKKITTGDPSRPPQRDIDLVFRSGGELRASGFFPLQTLYSEWVYSSALFPDVTVDNLSDAVSDYLQRKRNFGN